MKKCFVMLLISLTLLTSGIVYSHELNSKLLGKTIVIDAGHGGKDAGTNYGDFLEKDINLAIALKLRNELIKQGVNVIMTRDGDFDLSTPNAKRRKKSDFDNRIKVINTSNADLYLSIHINYLGEAKYYGAQTFYTKGNEKLAKEIQNGFKDDLKSPMDEKKLNDKIYMYKQLIVPGVLLECGFLSNSNERRLLVKDDYQEKIVNSIIKSLIKYY